MNTLPKYILFKIFSDLLKEDLVSLIDTCQRFRNLLLNKEFWEMKIIKEFGTLDVIQPPDVPAIIWYSVCSDCYNALHNIDFNMSSNISINNTMIGTLYTNPLYFEINKDLFERFFK